MSKEIFNKYKNMQVRTVGALIADLQKLPPDTRVEVQDADSGGYDVVSHFYCVVTPRPEVNAVNIGHFEALTNTERNKGNLTWEEYQELNKEDDITL